MFEKETLELMNTYGAWSMVLLLLSGCAFLFKQYMNIANLRSEEIQKINEDNHRSVVSIVEKTNTTLNSLNGTLEKILDQSNRNEILMRDVEKTMLSCEKKNV